MADETLHTEEKIDKQEFVGVLPIDFNSISSVQKFENVQLFEKEQCTGHLCVAPLLLS